MIENEKSSSTSESTSSDEMNILRVVEGQEFISEDMGLPESDSDEEKYYELVQSAGNLSVDSLRSILKELSTLKPANSTKMILEDLRKSAKEWESTGLGDKMSGDS